MKIILDQPHHDDIVIEEILEPQGAFYSIECGDNKVVLSQYQLEELVKVSKMFLNEY